MSKCNKLYSIILKSANYIYCFKFVQLELFSENGYREHLVKKL